MSWFVDASALVAILGAEADSDILADRLDEEDELIWSAVSIWESAVAISRRLSAPIEETQQLLAEFGKARGLTLVPIGADETRMALAAFARFGKHSGHPAQLNMGDCFAYACAKANDARLLYKGNDFAQTDLA